MYETVSQRQLRKGDRPWEGSWRQDLRADEQKPHTAEPQARQAVRLRTAATIGSGNARPEGKPAQHGETLLA